MQEHCTFDDNSLAGKLLGDEKSTDEDRERIFSGACQTGSFTDDDCSTKQTSSTDSSTDSERTYKFVNKWELKCKCEVDGENEEFEDAGTRSIVDNTDESDDDPDDDDDDTKIEQTLAIIKPEAINDRVAIENYARDRDFAIQQKRTIRLTPEQVSEFYGDDHEDPKFGGLVTYMSSGIVVAMVLAKKRAVREWRTLIGPTKVSEARSYFPESVRARWGRKGRDYQNAVHGSASRDDAEREIHFFFPDFVIEDFPKWEKCENYLWKVVNKVLANGLVLCCREKPADPILWLANWLLANNPKTTQPD